MNTMNTDMKGVDSAYAPTSPPDPRPAWWGIYNPSPDALHPWTREEIGRVSGWGIPLLPITVVTPSAQELSWQGVRILEEMGLVGRAIALDTEVCMGDWVPELAAKWTSDMVAQGMLPVIYAGWWTARRTWAGFPAEAMLWAPGPVSPPGPALWQSGQGTLGGVPVDWDHWCNGSVFERRGCPGAEIMWREFAASLWRLTYNPQEPQDEEQR